MAIKTERLPKAIGFLESTREALVNEIAASAGKARIHSKTLVDVQNALDILKAEAPKVEKPKAKVKAQTKSED